MAGPLLLAFASGKGGTGKSTAAVAVAQLLAGAHGLRVALVDLDPQAGATDYLGADPVDAPLTADPVTVASAPGVTLYRAGRALASASASAIGAHLERIVRGENSEGNSVPPDVIVADLSPALHDAAHRVVLALPEARLVFAVRLDGGGIRGAQELAAMAEQAGRPFVVAPMFSNARRALSAAMRKMLVGFYPDRVLGAAVPDDAKAAEAATVGQPVTSYAPRSKAAEALRAQTAELVTRFGLAPAGGIIGVPKGAAQPAGVR